MSGIKDVAKKAGVSISTVSNVLNKSKYVSPELVERVEKAVRELSYEVNPIARSMKNNKTGIIGVITEDICGVFYPYIVRGISSVAEEKGYQMIICDAQGIYGDQEAVKREEELFSRLFANRVDGIIFASAVSEEHKTGYLSKIKKRAEQHKRIPIVSVERDFTDLGIDSVYFDGYQNSIMAVQHLIDCGCKKITHIAGHKDMQIVQERINGYRRCLEDNGLPLDENSIVFGDYSHQSGYRGMQELLKKCPETDGVFCGNDQMAIGALKALAKAGKKVPEEIKVMGYDDVFVSAVVNPTLSTIHIKKRHTGIEAAKILFNRIENPEKEVVPIGIKMEGNLVIRNTTQKNAVEKWKLSDW